MSKERTLAYMMGSSLSVYTEDKYGFQGKFRCKEVLLPRGCMMSAKVKFFNSEKEVEQQNVSLADIVVG